VQIFDAATLEPLGPALGADITALDTLVQLAFSPDGERLVASSWLGYWLQWPVASDRRDATALAAALAPLAPEQEDQRVLQPPTAQERRALRTLDPGAWTRPQPRPDHPIARLTASRDAIPARAEDASATLVDLTRQYDAGPDAVRNFYYNVRPSMHPFPVGIQQIGGVPFDLRGMVQINVVDPASSAGHLAPTVLRCLEGVGPAVGGLNLLLDVSLTEPVTPDTPLVGVTLHYEDGSQALLHLRAGRELPGYGGADAAVPLVFAPNPLLAVAGLQDHPLARVRLANPHPQRRVRCLDIAPVPGSSPASMALLLLGITVEPASVIAEAQSRTTVQDADAVHPLPTGDPP
jgi:hypothetical protein